MTRLIIVLTLMNQYQLQSLNVSNYAFGVARTFDLTSYSHKINPIVTINEREKET